MISAATFYCADDAQLGGLGALLKGCIWHWFKVGLLTGLMHAGRRVTGVTRLPITDAGRLALAGCHWACQLRQDAQHADSKPGGLGPRGGGG
jgi:hypothetical protein